MQVVRELPTVQPAANDNVGKPRRVVILQREDGLFSFAEEYLYVSAHEGDHISQGWTRLSAHGFFATVDIAEAEARAMYSYLYGEPR